MHSPSSTYVRVPCICRSLRRQSSEGDPFPSVMNYVRTGACAAARDACFTNSTSTCAPCVIHTWLFARSFAFARIVRRALHQPSETIADHVVVLGRVQFSCLEASEMDPHYAQFTYVSSCSQSWREVCGRTYALHVDCVCV